MTNTKGNCLACHAANGKEIDGPGNMGPKLQFLALWSEEALYDKVLIHQQEIQLQQCLHLEEMVG